MFFGLLDLKTFGSAYNLKSKRDIETQGKNYLLNHLLGKGPEICYTDNGKPYLADGDKHISISHSHDKLAIIINETEPTGIDIELIRDKVLKIKHKFLSDSELKDAMDDIEKLLIYWAAKETLFKIYGLKEVNFIEHLFVESFIKNTSGVINGFINLPKRKETFHLNYQLLDNYVLVYTLDKINNC